MMGNDLINVTALEQFQPRFETIDGMRVSYRACGDGPTLVLLAGFGQSSAWWRHFVEPYTRLFRVLAPDFRGFGYSDKPRSGYLIEDQATLVLGLLSKLGFSNISIVGLSFGGVVALKIALLAPHLVENLVLVSTPFLRGPSINRPNMNTVPFVLRLLRNPVAARVIGAFRNRLITAAVFKKMAYPTSKINVSREVIKDLINDAFTNTWESLNGSALALVQENMEPRIYGVSVPTLIVHGQTDRMMPIYHAEGLHRAIPNSALTIVHNAGHGVMLHQKDRLSELILSFLCGHNSGR